MAAIRTMDIELDRTSRAPLYLQIAEAIRRRIHADTIRIGERLPSERVLAEMLNVNRSTVVAAYEELAADGLVERHVGRGTTVVEQGLLGSDHWSWQPHLAPPAASSLARILEGFVPQERVRMEVAEPSTDTLPVAAMSVLTQDVIDDLGGQAFSYVAAEGLPSLRRAVLDRYQGGGREDRAVLVTSGAMQAIDLVARAIVSPGDEVVVESPTYPGALDAFRRAGARLAPVPVDRDGIRTDLLERALRRGSVRLVFVIPQHQNPSGAVLSATRRAELIDLTRRYQAPLLDDGVYAELGYDGEQSRPLAFDDGADHVISISSMSKVLSGGIRVGWAIGSPALIESLTAIKQHVDVNTSSFLQHLAVRSLQSGLADEHLARVRPLYRERCDRLIAGLRRHAPGAVRFETPRGGLSLWCRLVDAPGPASEFTRIAGAHGVGIVPGDAFAVGPEHADRFRVSFANLRPREIDMAAERLGEALEEFGQRPVMRRASRPLV